MRTREEMEEKTRQILDECPTITLASVTEAGYPRCAILVQVAHEGFQKIYVSTGTSSRKTAHFRVNPKAGVSFGKGDDGVTLIGKVRILSDPAERNRYWQDWMRDHFPLGTEDPEFCVLEFTTEEATLWIENQFETYQY